MPRSRAASRPERPAPAPVVLEPLTLQSPSGLLERVRALRLLPDQDRFALAPAQSLAPALVDPDRTPFAVVERGEVVGFGVLGRRGVLEQLLDDPDRALLLRGVVVDAAHQGRGVGAATARAARALVTRVDPLAQLLVLTCHEDNPAGLRAYARAGFVDAGASYQDAGGGPQRVLVATVLAP